MADINNGGPAFPVIASNQCPIDSHGMTLRDYFAGKALQGICTQEQWELCPPEKIAEWAYEQADAMLKAREA